MRGVGIFDQAKVESTGDGAIALDGTAGAGLRDERGVEIGDAGTKVTSIRGDISITGRGAAGSDPVETYNAGVWIRNDAIVESTATSGTAAAITIEGTGGPARFANIGVWMTSAGKISSVLGNIAIDGEAGPSTAGFNIGVSVQSGSTIVSTGSATITAQGTGNVGTESNFGIWVIDANSAIRSLDGDIQLTGVAGAGTGINNHGVWIGTKPPWNHGQAPIRVTGTGGAGPFSSVRRAAHRTGRILSTHGDIEVVGTGGGNSSGVTVFNSGVAVQNGGRIEALPGGSANVTIQGTGGFGTPTPLSRNGGCHRRLGLGRDVHHQGCGRRHHHHSGRRRNRRRSHNHGVMLWDNVQAVHSTAAGALSITGSPGVDASSYGFRASRSGGILSTGTANLAIGADRIHLDPASAVNLGPNSLAVAPLSTFVAIDLGGADASGVLGLTDAELDRVTAGTIQIGNAGTNFTVVTGAISLNPRPGRPDSANPAPRQRLFLRTNRLARRRRRRRDDLHGPQRHERHFLR